MRHVIQKDENGCGMACVAMLAGVDYETSCKRLFRTKSGKGRYTHTKEIKAALRRAGLRTDRRCVRFKKDEGPLILQFDAIMITRAAKQHGTFHWVVWDSKARRVLDPDYEARKRKFSSYLRVYR